MAISARLEFTKCWFIHNFLFVSFNFSYLYKGWLFMAFVCLRMYKYGTSVFDEIRFKCWVYVYALWMACKCRVGLFFHYILNMVTLKHFSSVPTIQLLLRAFPTLPPYFPFCFIFLFGCWCVCVRFFSLVCLNVALNCCHWHRVRIYQ